MTATIETEAPDVVTRAQAGDSAAIAELWAEHRDVIFRFIYRRLGNPVHAEDLAADVFVRLIKRADTFEWRGTDIRAWLFVIARNLVADVFKSGRFRKEITAGASVDYAQSCLAGDPSPEDTATDRITYDLVLRMMDQLGDEQREVLRLRFLCDLTIAEVAVAMGKEEGAIKALQYRAVRSMRRLFPDGSPL